MSVLATVPAASPGAPGRPVTISLPLAAVPQLASSGREDGAATINGMSLNKPIFLSTFTQQLSFWHQDPEASGSGTLARLAAVADGDHAPALAARAAVRGIQRLALPEFDRLVQILDEADAAADTASTAEGTTVAAAGVMATSGYLLLNTRAGLWLLSLLASRPLWKQFDPMEVLFAWEEETRRRGQDAAEDDESLVSLVK
jgi:hypothetical protein